MTHIIHTLTIYEPDINTNHILAIYIYIYIIIHHILSIDYPYTVGPPTYKLVYKPHEV